MPALALSGRCVVSWEPGGSQKERAPTAFVSPPSLTRASLGALDRVCTGHFGILAQTAGRVKVVGQLAAMKNTGRLNVAEG